MDTFKVVLTVESEDEIVKAYVEKQESKGVLR